MIKETAFDIIFDAQSAFRVLLNAFSYPGTIYSFEKVNLNQPASFSYTNALIALSLFDNNTSFHSKTSYENDVENYIHLNTNAEIAEINKADYLFLNGSKDLSNELLQCKIGELSYPEKNATVIVMVKSLSNHVDFQYDYELRLQGPGIQERKSVFVSGLDIQNIVMLKNINTEFPLGIDLILTDSFENIISIPRSIAIEIFNKN